MAKNHRMYIVEAPIASDKIKENGGKCKPKFVRRNPRLR